MVKQIARGVLVFALLVLIGSWVVVILVDSLNIMSLGDRLIEQTPSNSSAFAVLFGEGRPVEWAQWFSLIAACMVTAYTSAIEQTHQNVMRHKFFILFSCLFALMVIEDAGNIRLTLIHLYAGTGFRPELGSFIPMIWYGFIAILPVMGVAMYGRTFMEMNAMWGFFVIGFACYFVAAAASAIGLGYYASAGDVLNSLLFDGRVVYEQPRSGYWIMDYLVEETIELVGAICFLYFSYWYYTDTTGDIKSSTGVYSTSN